MTELEWSRLEEIDWLFRRMVRKFIKERDKITIEGIALPAILILRTIERHGEQKLGDLAEQLDLSSGAITALCDKFEKKGFAVRRRLTEDRRTVLLDITEEGRSMLERNRDIGKKCITLLFDPLTEQEFEVQKNIFSLITQRLDRFAETILAAVEENANKPSAEASTQKDSYQSLFLNY